MLTRRGFVGSLAALALALAPTAAFADELVVGGGDAGTAIAPVEIPTVAAFITRTITLTAVDDVDWNGDDDVAKWCNLKNQNNLPGHGLTASVTSSNTAVATVSPS